MSEDAIGVGTILHWKGFTFADGATADKFLVIVGSNQKKITWRLLPLPNRRKRPLSPAGTRKADTITYLEAARIGFPWTPGCCSRSPEN